jgi:hypothetical protein
VHVQDPEIWGAGERNSAAKVEEATGQDSRTAAAEYVAAD